MTLLDKLQEYVFGGRLREDLATDYWSTLDVDYEPPRVERLWKPLPNEDARIYLHRIHPCEKALFHPHPWPSAVMILSGRYEMGVGFGSGEQEPPVAARTILAAGSCYEMDHPDGWHWVRPIGGPSLSVMITGLPWKRWSPSPEKKLNPLPPNERFLLAGDISRALDHLPASLRGV